MQTLLQSFNKFDACRNVCIVLKIEVHPLYALLKLLYTFIIGMLEVTRNKLVVYIGKIYPDVCGSFIGPGGRDSIVSIAI